MKIVNRSVAKLWYQNSILWSSLTAVKMEIGSPLCKNNALANGSTIKGKGLSTLKRKSCEIVCFFFN